jgi:hypothetical protein
MASPMARAQRNAAGGGSRLEASWQQVVLELAGYYGWRHYHPYDSRRSVPGWPDLILARPPELLAVELKTVRGRVSTEQRAWLDTLDACGIETAVWRPPDFDQVHDRLRRKATA